MDEVTQLPDDFDGLVRLFPLPDLVVFPHAMQPLHIFEPRYCDMLLESLAGDRLIAMATLLDASAHTEQAGLGQGVIHRTVCIGRVVSHIETDQGRHNILLIGAMRARIRRELETGRSFRLAEVDPAADYHPAASAQEATELKTRLLDAFAAVIPAAATVQQNLHELMTSQMGLGPISDIIAHTLPLAVGDKLRLLDLPDVHRRSRLLIQLLSERPAWCSGQHQAVAASAQQGGGWPAGTAKRFPPPFSLN